MTPQPIKQACTGGHSVGTGTACRAATTVWVQNVPMPSAGLRVTPSAVRMRGSALRLAAHRCGWPMAQKRQLLHGARQARMT